MIPRYLEKVPVPYSRSVYISLSSVSSILASRVCVFNHLLKLSCNWHPARCQQSCVDHPPRRPRRPRPLALVWLKISAGTNVVRSTAISEAVARRNANEDDGNAKRTTFSLTESDPERWFVNCSFPFIVNLCLSVPILFSLSIIQRSET